MIVIILNIIIMQWLLSSTKAASRPVLIAKVLHLQSVLIFFIFRSRCLLKDYVVVSLKLHVMTRAQWRNSLKLRLKANITVDFCLRGKLTSLASITSLAKMLKEI